MTLTTRSGQASAIYVRTSRMLHALNLSSKTVDRAVKLHDDAPTGSNSETTWDQSWETALHQKSLSPPLPTVPLSDPTRTPEMLRWFWRHEPAIFLVCWLLNKPLSFSTRTCLMSLAFLKAGSQTCGSFTQFHSQPGSRLPLEWVIQERMRGSLHCLLSPSHGNCTLLSLQYLICWVQGTAQRCEYREVHWGPSGRLATTARNRMQSI